MNLPEIKPYEEQAIDMVVSVINRAKEKLGTRLTLRQLAGSRNELATQTKVSLVNLGPPLAKTSEALIIDTIEKSWDLTSVLKYVLRYQGISQDESSLHYYYEAIFSQPIEAYPIPQATVSVFFRVADKHTEPPEIRGVPMMSFRIEGQHCDHDVRFVALTVDWILAVLKMKIKLFERIEGMRIY